MTEQLAIAGGALSAPKDTLIGPYLMRVTKHNCWPHCVVGGGAASQSRGHLMRNSASNLQRSRGVNTAF